MTTSCIGHTGLTFPNDMNHEARSKWLMQLSLSFIVPLLIGDCKDLFTTRVTLACILVKESSAFSTVEEFR